VIYNKLADSKRIL